MTRNRVPAPWRLPHGRFRALVTAGRSTRFDLRAYVRYAFCGGDWHDPDLGRPLERCAELPGVNLATICEAAANVEPYLRADGTRIWSLMQLERQLRPEAYGRRRGGYLDRRRTQQ
jgi:hypothetical protein